MNSDSDEVEIDSNEVKIKSGGVTLFESVFKVKMDSIDLNLTPMNSVSRRELDLFSHCSYELSLFAKWEWVQ